MIAGLFPHRLLYNSPMETNYFGWVFSLLHLTVIIIFAVFIQGHQWLDSSTGTMVMLSWHEPLSMLCLSEARITILVHVSVVSTPSIPFPFPFPSIVLAYPVALPLFNQSQLHVYIYTLLGIRIVYVCNYWGWGFPRNLNRTLSFYDNISRWLKTAWWIPSTKLLQSSWTEWR